MCAGVSVDLGLFFKGRSPISTCGYTISLKPWVQQTSFFWLSCVLQREVSGEAIRVSRVTGLDLKARDSVTAHGSPSRRASGALPCLLPSCPGSAGSRCRFRPPLSCRPALPSGRFAPLQSFRRSAAAPACWSEAVLCSRYHPCFL